MAGFAHAIAGGQGDLVVTQLQSPNFSIAAKTGWAIMKNGDAYFYDITAEGSVSSNTVIVSGSGEGLFVYSGTPANGNPPIIAISDSTVDPFGNAIESGTVVYVTISGTKYSLQLGEGNFAGTPAAAFFVGNPGDEPYSQPMFGGFGSPAGASAVLYSGQGTSGDTGSGIQAEDSASSGVPGGQVQIIGGQAVVQQDLIVNGNLIAGGTANQLSGTAITTIPASAPSRTALGSTWNSTTASECNQNFVNIINALGALGIFT